MASPLDAVTSMPLWQKLLLWVLVAGLIAAGWYFLWYTEATDGLDGAGKAKDKAAAELATMQEKQANFEEEQKKAAEMEAEMRLLKEELPLSDSSVDNLMQTFQQQARVVGMTVESWSPMGEEKQDFYAKLPVKVRAAGSWYQIGEFFRRVAELKQIVSVENLQLRSNVRVRRGEEAPPHPNLAIDFSAATFRFLTEEERRSGGTTKKSRRGGAK